MINLVSLAKSHGYGGYVLDLENTSPEAQHPALPRSCTRR